MQKELSTLDNEISLQEDIPLSYYFSILKNRKWHFLAILLTTVISTFFFTLRIPPTYEATTTILLDYTNPNPLEEQTNQLTSVHLTEYMNTEKSIVTTSTVALRVIKQLQLLQEPFIVEQYKKYKERLSLPFLKTTIKKDIETWLVDNILKKLTVKPNRDSRILEITFEFDFPDFAAKIANAFAQAYDTYHLELNVSTMKKNIDWISGKINELRENVGKKDKKFETYKANKGLISTVDRQSIAIQKLL